MTPSGRTNWLAKDARWWGRARIVKLGLEFGADGPAVIDWLSCEAKLQNDGGWVKSGNVAVSHGCFVPLEKVCPVLSRSVQLGLLDEMEGDEDVFTCRISGWKDDQERPLASVKKRHQRAGGKDEKPTNTGETPEGQEGTEGDLSPVVPECPPMSPTGQDRTEEQHPPNPPKGGSRQREVRDFEQQVQAYTADALGIHHEDGWQNVATAIRSGGARTTDDVLAFIKKWRPDILSEQKEVAA